MLWNTGTSFTKCEYQNKNAHMHDEKSWNSKRELKKLNMR